ncbi:MAG: DUF1588 domain-containing protein [Hyphomicrobiaceae bacterium]
MTVAPKSSWPLPASGTFGLLALAGLLAVTLPKAQAQAPTQTPPAEQHLQALDPALYEAARTFFPSDESGLPPRRIFRLTRDQIDVTVEALLPKVAKRSVKTAVPRDPLQTNYEFADLLGFNAANVRGLKGWIAEIAAAVKADPTHVVDCAAQKNAPDCLKVAASRFIRKAFRDDTIYKAAPGDESNPATSHAKVVELADGFVKNATAVGVNQAAADLVEVVLTSPDFLFRKQLATNRRGLLSPKQLLQELTYTLADGPPDALNLDVEQAPNYFQTARERQDTIDTILASKAAQAKLVRFFKAWLEIREPGDFTISQQLFKQFTDKAATTMVGDSERFLREELAKPAPRLADITLSTRAFLAQVAEPKKGAKAAEKATVAEAGPRLGIFTHPAVLASHSGPTSSAPIKRGVFFARKVMCLDLEAPPQGLDLTIYEKPGATERERIEAVTGQTACIGCHKIIDPLGFFQDSYDALGRWRDKDEEGRPIDASMAIRLPGSGTLKTTTTEEALKALTGSHQFKQCFVRQLFRFYMGRKEEPSDDRLLREMFVTFAHKDNQEILALVRRLATSDRVSMRQPAPPTKAAAGSQ